MNIMHLNSFFQMKTALCVMFHILQKKPVM